MKQPAYDVLILGLSRWDNPLNSSTFSLAREFAKSRRVFYVDRPFSVKDYLTKKKLKPVNSRSEAILFGRNRFREVVVDGISFINIIPPLSLPVNRLPGGLLYDLASRFTRYLV